MTSDTDELHITVEEIRSANYPSLPAGLVAGLLECTSQFLDDPVEAEKRISDLIDAHVQASN